MSDLDAVGEIIDAVSHPGRRADAATLIAIMGEVTGEEPRVWSGGTIGFGRYHYRYASGQEGDFFQIGLAPRKDKLTLYVMSGLRGFEDILERLGPHTAAKSTIHLRSLDGIDRAALAELISECVRHLESVEAKLGAIPRMSDIPPRDAG
ncbi:MAG: DUF1801 domain-containing protein [Acidimicrobiia bacterium]|nr:DUF1801 domain-containing protein [Acidimicrobiia bacterium]